MEIISFFDDGGQTTDDGWGEHDDLKARITAARKGRFDNFLAGAISGGANALKLSNL